MLYSPGTSTSSRIVKKKISHMNFYAFVAFSVGDMSQKDSVKYL